jgi:uncharacterized membrane protein YciS (DUF1049 family)
MFEQEVTLSTIFITIGIILAFTAIGIFFVKSRIEK